jgi:MFS family permease
MISRLGILPTEGSLRAFAIANIINTVGSGLYLAGSALFFTHVVRLGVDQVAVGLTIGTAVGLALATRFGRLADLYGPKLIYLVLLLVQASAMAAFTLVRSYLAFLVVAIVSGIADRGIAGTVGAFVHHLGGRANRLTARAQLRATTNVGLGVGTLLASAALVANTSTAYTLLIAGNSLLFLITALMVARLATPRIQLRPRGQNAALPDRSSPIRNRPYLLVAAGNGLLSLHVTTLSFAVPLWIADRTTAPIWILSVILVVNTVLVIGFQVRVSAGAKTVAGGVRLSRRAGLALATSCILMAVTPHVGSAVVVVLLLLWACVFTFGELCQSSGGFCFSFELAPDTAHGAFQSAFSLGPGVMRACGPSLLAALVLKHGTVGWFALAMLFLVAALFTSLAAASASRQLCVAPASIAGSRPGLEK